MKDEIMGRDLLEAICNFTLQHTDPEIDRFRHSLVNWGSEFSPCEPVRFPAADNIGDAAKDANSPVRELLELFDTHKEHLFWEQSYTREDDLVSEEMLANYCFVEVVGSRGPFVSDRIRIGLSNYGPGVIYPRHWHEAEEIYLLLSGTAEFTIDGIQSKRGPGDIILIESNTTHGFVVDDDRALVLIYLWQAGELRQTSAFG